MILCTSAPVVFLLGELRLGLLFGLGGLWLRDFAVVSEYVLGVGLFWNKS